jgi:hypothetical protein
MKLPSLLTMLAGALTLAACATHAKPMTLRIPPPPDATPGSIRVYGDHLPPERAEHVRETLRAAEPKILAQYERYVQAYPGVEGRVQLRIGVNAEGKAAEIARVYSEVNEGLGTQVRPIFEKLDFGPGPEAYAYYTLEFRPDPLEVLNVTTDFAATPPVLVAQIENRSAFHLPAVSATVTVLGPEKSKPLRVYRRKVKTAFSPRERRTIRIPVGSEWATTRNSFLVVLSTADVEEAANPKEAE